MRSRYRECEAKTRYVDEHQANKGAGRCERERGLPLRAYECSFCGGWHLTRTPDKATLRYQHDDLWARPKVQSLAVLPPQVRNAYAPGEVTGARFDMARGFEIVVEMGTAEHVWRFEHPVGGWRRQ